MLLGRPSKLSLEQQPLGFLLYMKHDPTTTLPSFLWNWCIWFVIDDQIFIASSINWALKDKIKWSHVMEKQALASMVLNFPGCIGIIDSILVKIRRP